MEGGWFCLFITVLFPGVGDEMLHVSPKHSQEVWRIRQRFQDALRIPFCNCRSTMRCAGGKLITKMTSSNRVMKDGGVIEVVPDGERIRHDECPDLSPDKVCLLLLFGQAFRREADPPRSAGACHCCRCAVGRGVGRVWRWQFPLPPVIGACPLRCPMGIERG